MTASSRLRELQEAPSDVLSAVVVEPDWAEQWRSLPASDSQLRTVVTLWSALPQIIALVEAAEGYIAYWNAREATWATYGQCEDDGHIGHTEDTCPAWGSVASATMSEGDHAPIAAALADLTRSLG